jgi:hypothetical protein
LQQASADQERIQPTGTPEYTAKLTARTQKKTQLITSKTVPPGRHSGSVSRKDTQSQHATADRLVSSIARAASSICRVLSLSLRNLRCMLQ